MVYTHSRAKLQFIQMEFVSIRSIFKLHLQTPIKQLTAAHNNSKINTRCWTGPMRLIVTIRNELVKQQNITSIGKGQRQMLRIS